MNVNGKVAEWPGATDIDLGIGVNEYIATMRAGRAAELTKAAATA